MSEEHRTSTEESLPAPTSGSSPARREQAQPTPAEPERPGLLASVAGFGVTFATMGRTPVTESYPEQKVPTAARYHGRHQLNRHPDGLEKCVGCELCAWACPADAIYVEGAPNTDVLRFSPGERYGRVYQINYLRCIGCGLCIEACPTRALTMTNEYEIADDNRQNMIFEKQDLLGPILDGMVPAPHPMVQGCDEADYYAGRVSGATPAQREWVSEHQTQQQEQPREEATVGGEQ